MDRARNSIRSLMQLAPAEATLIEVCTDCEEHVGRLLPDGSPYTGGACPWCTHETPVPVGDLAVGDRILVKPGERIAMDGRVDAGASAVNQAPITGESVPVEKPPGSDVFAGSINGAGALGGRGDAARGRQYDQPHHPHGRGGPGAEGARAALDRPVRPLLHAGGGGTGGAGRRRPAAPVRPALPRPGRRDAWLAVPRAGAADHRLPLRAGHFDPGQHRERDQPGRAAGRAHQGRRLPRSRRQPQRGRLRQDGHPDARRAGGDARDQPERGGRGRRAAGGGRGRSPLRAPAGARRRAPGRSPVAGLSAGRGLPGRAGPRGAGTGHTAETARVGNPALFADAGIAPPRSSHRGSRPARAGRQHGHAGARCARAGARAGSAGPGGRGRHDSAGRSRRDRRAEGGRDSPHR